MAISRKNTLQPGPGIHIGFRVNVVVCFGVLDKFWFSQYLIPMDVFHQQLCDNTKIELNNSNKAEKHRYKDKDIV